VKIAYVHSGKFPSNTPSMTFILFNAIGLSQSFEKVFLMVKNNLLKTTEEILTDEYGIKLPTNIIVERIRILFNIKSSAIYYFLAYKKLKKIIPSDGLNAVITRNIKFLPWLIRLKKKYGVKIYFESHDLYSRKLLPDSGESKITLNSKLEMKYIPLLDGVFCLQETQLRLYKELFKEYDKFYLARTGINKVIKVDFNGRKNLAYIGSFDEHKGIGLLIEVFSEIECPHKLLLIGGKTQKEIDAVKKIIAKYKAEDKIFVTGWISKNEIQKYLASTIIGIVPLEPTFFNTYLTSPLKIFDYFSYGIPILASDLPTIRELILENEMGTFYEPSKKVDMKRKLIGMLNDLKSLEKMSMNIYKYAEKMTWANRAQIIFSVIREK